MLRPFIQKDTVQQVSAWFFNALEYSANILISSLSNSTYSSVLLFSDTFPFLLPNTIRVYNILYRFMNRFSRRNFLCVFFFFQWFSNQFVLSSRQHIYISLSSFFFSFLHLSVVSHVSGNIYWSNDLLCFIFSVSVCLSSIVFDYTSILIYICFPSNAACQFLIIADIILLCHFI